MAVLKAAAHGVFHAAGLSAHTAVAAAPADERGHIALPRMAEAQRAVDKYLRFYRRTLCDEFYLLKRQLPGEHSAGKAHFGRRLDSGEVVDAHLRAGVERYVWQGPPQDGQQPQILHQYRRSAQLRHPAGQSDRFLHLPVTHQRVHGDIDLAVSDAAVAHCPFKLLVAEVFRAPAGIEVSKSHIYGVRAVLNRGYDRLRRAGRRKQFEHIHTSGILYNK